MCARQHYTLNPIILADYWLDSVCSLCRWSRLTLSLPCLVRLHIYIINYITLLLIIFYTSSRSSSRILYAHTQKYTITRVSENTRQAHIFGEKHVQTYTRLKDKKRKYKTINKKITKIKLKHLEKTSILFGHMIRIFFVMRIKHRVQTRTNTYIHANTNVLSHTIVTSEDYVIQKKISSFLISSYFSCFSFFFSFFSANLLVLIIVILFSRHVLLSWDICCNIFWFNV